PELMQRAKEAGKLPGNYELPGYARENTPEHLEQALQPIRERGLMPLFPFGTDFDETEQRLIPALQRLQAASASLVSLVALAFLGKGEASSDEKACLARLGLDRGGFKNDLYGYLLRGALRSA